MSLLPWQAVREVETSPPLSIEYTCSKSKRYELQQIKVKFGAVHTRGTDGKIRTAAARAISQSGSGTAEMHQKKNKDLYS